MQSQQGEVQSQLDAIVKSHDQKKALDGLDILFKLLSNIVKNPNEDKYRQIKGTNKTIAEKLMSLTGVQQLLLTMGFQELEQGIYLYIGENVLPVAKFAHMVDDVLMPIRMEYMTPDDRAKAVIIMERKAAMKEKARKEQEHADQVKKRQDYDR